MSNSISSLTINITIITLPNEKAMFHVSLKVS